MRTSNTSRILAPFARAALLVAALIMLVGGNRAPADVITLTGGDAGEGFAPRSTVHAAVSFGQTGVGPVQGVTFNTNASAVTMAGNGTTTGGGADFTKTTTNDTNLGKVFTAGYYSINSVSMTATVTGLTAGLEYQLDSFIGVIGSVARTEYVQVFDGSTPLTANQQVDLTGGSPSPAYDVRQTFTAPSGGTVQVKYTGTFYPVVCGLAITYATSSTACDMLSFSWGGYTGVIDEGAVPNPTVTVHVPYGTNLNPLNPNPTYAVSPGAACPKPNGGSGSLDFTSPQTYTVTAADGITAKAYHVTVACYPVITPTGLTATAGDAEVQLTWTAASGATGYNVKRSTTNGGPYTTIGTTTTATSYLDTTAVNGTPYYYVVSATNSSGEGADTAQVAATPARVAGVTVGSSTLIDTLDYSDTWTIGAGATTVDRQTYVPGSFPPGAAVLAVENTYGNPAQTWQNFGSIATDSAVIVPGTPTFPGGSGAGSATGFTQAGFASAFAFGMAYDIRSNYVVQWDAVQTADWVGVVTGVNTTSPLASNNLLVYFKPTGSGDGSIHLFSNGIGDKTTGIATGVTTGTWNNYAVAFELTNKVLRFYTNQTLLGQVDLTTFDGGSFSSLAGAATTNDRIGLAVSGNGANRLWTDNFQVGLPPGFPYTITATAGTGGSISPSGIQSVALNSTPTYTITPDIGYDVSDVVVDGTTHLGPVTTYTFAAVTAAHTIDATFVGVLPTAPTSLTATAGDAKVLLMWTAASGATGYDVKRSETNGGPYTTIASTTTATHYFDTSVTNGTPYYYVVSATNATGESADTAQAVATPGTTPTAGVIYSDGFSGSASNNLAGQTTTVGGGTWIGSSAWKADGSAGTNVGSNGDAMYLPLAVAANAKYTLSLTTTMATAGNWCSLGFANFASPPAGTEAGPWVSGNRWGPWMINGATGLGQTFLQNLDGLVNYGDLGHDLKIVLDTASTGWTAEYFVNGASIRGPVALGISSANYVMFAKNGGTATVDNFELSVAPYTAPAAPTIDSITAGNGTLSVAFTAGSDGGAPITNYKYSTDDGSTWTAVDPVATTSPILISGLTNGTTYQVKILAVNSAGDGAASAAVPGTPAASGTSYATWESANGASGGANADSNHNGVSNGIEFFMGGTAASPATLPALVNTAGTWSWTIPYDPAALATYQFRVSDNLSGWTDIAPPDASITVLTSPDRIQFTLPAGTGKKFCQLVVTTP